MASAHPGAVRPDRYPVQHAVDGDFTLAEIISAVGRPTHPAPHGPHPGLARAVRRAQLWRLGGIDADACAAVLAAAAEPPRGPYGDASDDDVAVLHAFEVSPRWRPPVALASRDLTPAAAEAWLALARHWIGVSATTADLRFFNAACKLLGTVWGHAQPAAGGQPDAGRQQWAPLAHPLATVAHLAGAATDALTAHLSGRLAVPAPAPLLPEPDLVEPPTSSCHPPPSVVVLAGAGSASALRFLAAATGAAVPITAVCWYGDRCDLRQAAGSAYATAWYPPERVAPTTTPRRPPAHLPQLATPTWDAVATALQNHGADLVVLLGMPIAPATILDLARLGAINAHNGALPHYRGMDAVGWAAINNDPVVCTLHLARAAVDQGEILAATPVPYTPTGTLHARVKTAQLRLLLAATRFVTTTGRLPSATPQHTGRQFYRLHPHLKRVLDTWTNSQTDQADLDGRRRPLP
jgi:folate-dependent phosphoribosylglycinamide formyltransferase PurN